MDGRRQVGCESLPPWTCVRHLSHRLYLYSQKQVSFVPVSILAGPQQRGQAEMERPSHRRVTGDALGHGWVGESRKALLKLPSVVKEKKKKNMISENAARRYKNYLLVWVLGIIAFLVLVLFCFLSPGMGLSRLSSLRKWISAWMYLKIIWSFKKIEMPRPHPWSAKFMVLGGLDLGNCIKLFGDFGAASPALLQGSAFGSHSTRVRGKNHTSLSTIIPSHLCLSFPFMAGGSERFPSHLSCRAAQEPI